MLTGGGAPPRPPSSSSFVKSESVKVWSSSRNAWLDGIVEEYAAVAGIMDGYSVPAGAVKISSSSGVKWIMPELVPGQVQKVASRPMGGYPAEAATVCPPVAPAPGLCKWGCGRKVQPGLTRGLKAYDTCCKRCGTTQGKGGHDENCGGTRISTRTSSGLTEDIIDVKLAMLDLLNNKSKLSTYITQKVAPPVEMNQAQVDAAVLRLFPPVCGREVKLQENILAASMQKYGRKRAGLMTSDEFATFCHALMQEKFNEWFPPKLCVSTEGFVMQNRRPLESVYNIGKKLGEGSFGTVHEAIHRISGQRRVCKKIDLKSADLPVEDILKEIENMANLDHPNVIKVYEYFNDGKVISQIMEPCHGGELQDRIDAVYRKGQKNYDEAFIQDVMKQTMKALAFMHSLPCAHKDLKPQNIMMTQKDTSSIKIIDFGLAEIFDPKQEVASFVGGTLLYMAPEAFDRKLVMKSDVWSAGVILYQLITGTLPYLAQWPPPPGRDERWWSEETQQKIKYEPMARHANLSNVSSQCQSLLQQMLQKNVDMRPSAAECLNHPWFQTTTATPTLSVGVVQCIEAYSRLDELKKAVFLLMAHQSALPALEELRAIFTHFDERNRGTLSSTDLRLVMRSCGLPSLLAERVIHALDRDGNGTIGWTEFTAAAICQAVSNQSELIDAAFATFDMDCDFQISQEDLLRVLGGKNPARLSAMVPQLFAELRGAEASGGGAIAGMMRRGSSTSVSRERFRDYMSEKLDIRSGDGFFAV